MYSRKSWGGSIDPFISVTFEPRTEEDQDPIVSMVIFEWRDERFVGIRTTPDAVGVGSPCLSPIGLGWLVRRLTGSDLAKKEYICDDENIQAKLCNDTQIGQFIVHPDAGGAGKSSIVTQAVHVKEPPSIKYPIKRTGYYCVGTYGYSADAYKAVVQFRNAYGELPAAQIAKLPFYGGLTIVYAVIGACVCIICRAVAIG